MASVNKNREDCPRSPDELLLRRIRLHEQAAAGEIDSKESREFHAFEAEKVREELAELVRRGAERLEAMQGRARLSEVLAADGERIEPSKIAVAELNLCDRTINGLERYGVLWASELAQWTEAKILTARMFGASVVAEIRSALAGVGLSLRVPTEGEECEAASPVDEHPPSATIERPGGNRRRKMLIALAGGASEREAAFAAGFKANQFAAVTRFKRAIRDRLQRGDAAAEIAADEGFPPGSVLGGSIAAYLGTLRTLHANRKNPLQNDEVAR